MDNTMYSLNRSSVIRSPLESQSEPESKTDDFCTDSFLAGSLEKPVFQFTPISEFEQTGVNSTSNLTDFRTRVVWSSNLLRYHVNQIDEGVPLSPSQPPPCAPKVTSDLYNAQQNVKKDNASNAELVTVSNSQETSSISLTPPIWRPFSSPDPIPNPLPTYPAPPELSTEEQGRNLLGSLVQSFPTISPSHVKLGGSTTSVFRVVKKKKYQCQFCDISFLNSGQLSGHIRVHTGSKPFRCEYLGCERAFARNEELTRHRRIHSGDKPHHCDVCQKRFGRKDHLNKHRKTHLKTSEKKVYLCRMPGCGHRYTRSDALTRHQTMAHALRHIRTTSAGNSGGRGGYS